MAEVSGALADALRERYPIERRLGSGGTATVYLARDLKHGRLVALKVLHAELAATLGPQRFEREIRVSARLQHPHILTVLDSGEAAGQLWFTMPYVRGESLRDRLRREGALPVEDALRITCEALQALACAHGEGVVHRDIKPENLLLAQDGSTLVADFGIARALGGGDAALTETGLVVGTPAYMSPEQATAGAVDGRSDLYSLACVCYEMLAGEPPYAGPTPQAIIAKRFHDPVPSVRRLRAGTPPGVDDALRRALATVPADRFATAAEFARALQLTTPTPAPARRTTATALVLALVLVAAAGVVFAWWSRAAAFRSGGPGVLAVLPFENLGDSADGYFADGVTDEVRTKLSQVGGIEVIARGSSNQYRGSTKPPQQIARELGARYLLTATVRWQKGSEGVSRVRVIPELVEIRPGGAPSTRWEQPFDASLTDVFQVQADIAGKVAGALDVALADSTARRLAARPTRNLAAYDAFLRGDRLIISEGRIDPASTRQAAEAYGQAVALDSTFALAWARLARAEVMRYDNGESSEGRDTVARTARRAADRALRLAPDRAESYYALAYVRGSLDLDGRGSLEAVQHAWTLAPNDVDVLSLLAGRLSVLGRPEEALARFAEAARLDPRSLTVARRYANALTFQRHFREADSVASAALRLAPDNVSLVEILVGTRLMKGETAGARTALHAALRQVDLAQLIRNTDPSNYLWIDDSLLALALQRPPAAFADDRPEGLDKLAWLQWSAGRYAQARITADSAVPLLEAQRARQPADPRVPALLIDAYALTGRRAQALAESERWRALVHPEPNTPARLGWLGQRFAIDLFSGDPGAVDWLDSLLHGPGGITREILRIYPGFAPLRRDPRFQRLLVGK